MALEREVLPDRPEARRKLLCAFRAAKATYDDANVRADLTPLSTKVAGLVARGAVADYQAVKAGDLLVQLHDDDFRAQVQQAVAAVTAAEGALINNRRQKELLANSNVADGSESQGLDCRPRRAIQTFEAGL